MSVKKLFCMVLLLVVATNHAYAAQLPLEDFFKKPQFAAFQLSPMARSWPPWPLLTAA